MKTSYLSCVIMMVVCLGCTNNGSGTKPPIVDHQKEVPSPPIMRVQEPPKVQPPVKVENLPGCKKETADLFPIPREYGRPIPGSSGKLTYCRENTGDFLATIVLNGLKESHRYKLALNGKVGEPGNDLLPKKHNNGEGYVDIKTIETDKDGFYKDNWEIVRKLDPGEYEVKFFVKDQAVSGWPVVLNNDNLSFTITK